MITASAQETIRVEGGHALTLNHVGPLTPSELLTRPRIAIVGARAATAYGVHIASQLAIDAMKLGYVVISGGAYGIDAAAHRGALAEKGLTVAVLGNGADVNYPRGNADLLNRVRTSGAVLSELPDGATPTRTSFLARNRVIALLAQHVIVVECSVRSGSLNTVEHALTYHRKVYAVPGPVTSALSAGTNDLLKTPDVRCLTGLADLSTED